MKYPDPLLKDDPRKNISWPRTRIDVQKLTMFDALKAGKIGNQWLKKHKENFVSYKGKKMTYRTKEKGEHYQLIVNILRAKLRDNPPLQKLLLKTGNLELLPDHYMDQDSPPAWKYHKIYMQLRKELRQSQKI